MHFLEAPTSMEMKACAEYFAVMPVPPSLSGSNAPAGQPKTEIDDLKAMFKDCEAFYFDKRLILASQSAEDVLEMLLKQVLASEKAFAAYAKSLEVVPSSPGQSGKIIEASVQRTSFDGHVSESIVPTQHAAETSKLQPASPADADLLRPDHKNLDSFSTQHPTPALQGDTRAQHALLYPDVAKLLLRPATDWDPLHPDYEEPDDPPSRQPTPAPQGDTGAQHAKLYPHVAKLMSQSPADWDPLCPDYKKPDDHPSRQPTPALQGNTGAQHALLYPDVAKLISQSPADWDTLCPDYEEPNNLPSQQPTPAPQGDTGAQHAQLYPYVAELMLQSPANWDPLCPDYEKSIDCSSQKLMPAPQGGTGAEHAQLYPYTAKLLLQSPADWDPLCPDYKKPNDLLDEQQTPAEQATGAQHARLYPYVAKLLSQSPAAWDPLHPNYKKPESIPTQQHNPSQQFLPNKQAFLGQGSYPIQQEHSLEKLLLESPADWDFNCSKHNHVGSDSIWNNRYDPTPQSVALLSSNNKKQETFSRFKDLPGEIRNKIWKIATDDEANFCNVRIRIEHGVKKPSGKGFSYRLTSITKVPTSHPSWSQVKNDDLFQIRGVRDCLQPLLVACRESRSVAVGSYKYMFGTTYFPARIPFNLEKDCLALQPYAEHPFIDGGDLVDLAEYIHENDRNRIRRLVVHFRDYKHDRENFPKLFTRCFRNIEKLIIQVPDIPPYFHTSRNAREMNRAQDIVRNEIEEAFKTDVTEPLVYPVRKTDKNGNFIINSKGKYAYVKKVRYTIPKVKFEVLPAQRAYALGCAHTQHVYGFA